MNPAPKTPQPSSGVHNDTATTQAGDPRVSESLT